MTFLLMEWCSPEYINDNKHKCLSFNGKIIVDKIFDEPEVFKLVVDDKNNVIEVENLEFEKLKQLEKYDLVKTTV